MSKLRQLIETGSLSPGKERKKQEAISMERDGRVYLISQKGVLWLLFLLLRNIIGFRVPKSMELIILPGNKWL